MSDLAYVRDAVAGHMTEIVGYFKQPAKITVIVRRPGFPDQDFMMTNDDPAEVVAMVERRRAGGESKP